MKQNILWRVLTSLLGISCFSLTSCDPGSIITDPYIVNQDRQRENTYYVPAAPHTPLITEKNDFNFNILRSSGNKFNGAEVQLAYMPWNHVAIGGSFSGGGNRGGTPKTMTYNRFELSSGYIKKISNGWHFESYAGLGTGNIKNYHYTGQSTIKLNHFFLQPAMAISNLGQTMQFAFSSRFAGVNFNVTDTLFNTDREPFSASQLNSLYDQPFHIMWEPSLIFRGGWKNLLFTLQYNHSSDFTNPDLYRSADNFSFGISLRTNVKPK